MSFLFDILIIAIIAFTVYRGVSRGFVRTVLGFAALAAAIVCAYCFTPPVAQMYGEKLIGGSITTYVGDSVTSIAERGGETFDLSELFKNKPRALTDLFERFGADYGELERDYGEMTAARGENIRGMAERIAKPIENTIANVLAFISVFAASLIVFRLIVFIVDMIFKLPVLKTANKILGFSFGLICAMLYAWLFSVSAAFLLSAAGTVYPQIEGTVDGSYLLKFFSETSPLLFVESVLK